MGKRKCAIVSCGQESENSNISFHKFPSDPKVRKMWLTATNLLQRDLRSSSTICSRHFRACDYFPNTHGKLIKLAVPKLFLFTPTSVKLKKTDKTVVKQTKKETEAKKIEVSDKRKSSIKNITNTRLLPKHSKLEKRKQSDNYDSVSKKFKRSTGEKEKSERLQNQKVKQFKTKSLTDETSQGETPCDSSSYNKRYWSCIQETITEMQEKIKSLESKSIQDEQKIENFQKVVMQQRKEEIKALLQERENELILRMDGLCLDYDPDRICRLCLLEKGGPLISLFQPNRKSLLIKKIERWTGIQVEKEDGMPNGICCECSIQMERADWFKKRSEKANDLLKKFIEMKKTANTIRELHHPVSPFEEENLQNIYTNQVDQGQSIKIEIEDVFSLENIVEQNFEVRVKEEIEDMSFFEAADILRRTENIDKSKLPQTNFYPKKKYCMKCNTHVYNCLEKKDHSIPCNECGKHFWDRQTLKKHILMRFACFVPVYKRTCNVCNTKFRWKWQLNVHCWQHCSIKSHSCMICEERFTYLPQLKKHITTHF